jgi:hypothetical protein
MKMEVSFIVEMRKTKTRGALATIDVFHEFVARLKNRPISFNVGGRVVRVQPRNVFFISG